MEDEKKCCHNEDINHECNCSNSCGEGCHCGDECNCGNECHCGEGDHECSCGEDCKCHESECECEHEEVKEKKGKKIFGKNKKEVEELNTKLNDLNDKYLRLNAEYSNFRTRTSQEIEKMFKYSNEELALELLGVVDNFERAIKMDDNDLSDEVSKFLSGFKMIYTSMIGTLNKIGVSEIDVIGKEFDPHVADAVITESDANKPEGVVLEVLQKGYMYKDKVLRPAMVKVNK